MAFIFRLICLRVNSALGGEEFEPCSERVGNVRQVTKLYYGRVEFDAGSAELTDEYSKKEIGMVTLRAHMIPTHRIDIVTHEDPTDSRDKGMAVHRLDTLRRFCLAESIPENRLELHTHPELCSTCRENSGEYARYARACAFPCTASLSDVGEFYLSFEEVVTLQSAREALMSKNYERWQELEKQYSPAGWRRIVGHDSLREWLRAGADHPLYGPAIVRVPYRYTAPCPYCGKPLRTKVAKQCRFCGKDWHNSGKVGEMSVA